MIVKLLQDHTVEEMEVVIKYSTMNEEVSNIANMLQSAEARIKCHLDGIEKYVRVSDIYYFESVDKMTFVYCEKDVCRTEYRLYQLVDDFAHLGFVQISKSCVLNINVLDSLKALSNSRMEAILKNNESVHVTRKYLANIKKALQGGV